jgi:general secretion pathway protein D
MVFIKPTIITEKGLMNAMAEEKYNYIRADQLRKQEEGLSLMKNSNLPILPEWQDNLTLPPSFDEYMKEVDPNKAEDDTVKDVTDTQDSASSTMSSNKGQ